MCIRDRLKVSVNQQDSSIELLGPVDRIILDQIAFSGDVAERCLDIASDVVSGKRAMREITFNFSFEVISSSIGGPTPSPFPVGTTRYHYVEIHSCSIAQQPSIQDRNYYKRNYYKRNYYKSCLLYTSPSPRDATLSRMPSSA